MSWQAPHLSHTLLKATVATCHFLQRQRLSRGHQLPGYIQYLEALPECLHARTSHGLSYWHSMFCEYALLPPERKHVIMDLLLDQGSSALFAEYVQELAGFENQLDGGGESNLRFLQRLARAVTYAPWPRVQDRVYRDVTGACRRAFEVLLHQLPTSRILNGLTALRHVPDFLHFQPTAPHRTWGTIPEWVRDSCSLLSGGPHKRPKRYLDVPEAELVVELLIRFMSEEDGNFLYIDGHQFPTFEA